MKRIRLIFLILFVFSLSSNGQTNNSHGTALKRNHITHHNKIDDINSAEEIEDLIGTIDDNYIDFLVSDSLIFSDNKCQRLFDSLKVNPWIKKDFDGNGYNDLLVVGNGNGHDAICIMDSGENKFFIKQISRMVSQDCTFPIVTMVNQMPVIINYSITEPDRRNNKIQRTLKGDTLVFKFGDFVEFNKFPAKHKIKKIEYSTDNCLGSCPVFEMYINSNRKATFNAEEYNEIEGEFTTKIDKSSYNLLINLLNYIDFAKLDSHYSISRTDYQACTLKITYDNGKTKEINDYGLIGTFGLIRTYDILFKLRENQKWKELLDRDKNSDEFDKGTERGTHYYK